MVKEYFKDEEIACKHCLNMGVPLEQAVKYDAAFRHTINRIREDAGFPFIVTSWYRCPNHPIEAAKAKLGSHTTGAAVDIAASGAQAYAIVQLAIAYGIRRIGVNQTGSQRFIHLDRASGFDGPIIWSY